MNNRPKSISFIAYFLIVAVFVAFIRFLLTDTIADFAPEYYFILQIAIFTMLLLNLLLAIGIYGGHNRARLIFLWTTPVIILISFFIYPAAIITQLVWMTLYILLAIFLIKKPGSDYFKGNPGSFISTYSKCADTFSKKIGESVSWLTTLMVLVVCYDVVTRYFFKISSVAIQEMEWHLFAVIFLLGAAYTLKADRHVRVDVLYIKFSPKNQAYVNFLGCLIFLIPFCILVVLSSKNFVANSFKFMESSPDPGGLPARFLLKLSIPLGFAMLLVQGLSMMLKSLRVIVGFETKDEGATNG